MRFQFRPAPSRNFRGFSCKKFLLSCLRASWFIISKFCEAFLNSKTKTYGKVRNITWTVFAIINLYANFRTIASGKSGNSDSAPCIIAIHQHLLIPEKIRNRTYKLIPAWNCCKLALCHLSISINISIYSIRFICPLSTCIPGRQNGIRCSMLPFIMPWFLRMCCLLSSCCCMYSNCCWIDVDVPARALGSFAHFSYLLAKWSNCILNLLRTKCSKLFCNLRSNNRKKKMQDSSKESGTAWGLLVAAQRSSLTTHQDLPPGFVTCHNVQSARPAAKKPPRSLSRFEQWGGSPGKQGVVNGQHLCMLHKWRSISFCIFTRCKKHHSIASLAAKSIVPAALMENVPYQHADCHKLPDTVFHLERPKQFLTMAQLGCLKSIFWQVWRTQLGHSWHMCCKECLCVCACSCACVVEGNTRYNVHAQRERERERESASQEELYVVAGILRHSQLSELRHRASILL